MSTLSKHHKKLTNGIGKCSVPMFQGGCPAGFCDEPAFGKQTKSLRVWHAHKQRYVRADGKSDAYAPGLACPIHAGPKCPGIEIEPGVFSGCNGKHGDCPTCER